MRRRHSLGGTDRLGEDAVPELALHGVAHHQVHPATKDLLEPVLNAEEVEEAYGAIEVDQQVHVAGRPGLAARDRAEQVERADAERLELGSHPDKSLDGLLTGHRVIVGRSAEGGQPAGVRLVVDARNLLPPLFPRGGGPRVVKA